MANLADVARVAAGDNHLAVVATTRSDGSVQASVVNAGVTSHPVTGEGIVGFVTYGPAKLAHLRARPQVAVTFRSGWVWVTVEGRADIAGPDDPLRGVDAETLRLLLRRIFTDAGGSHDDWEEYDRAMARERRAAVLVTPERVYSS